MPPVPDSAVQVVIDALVSGVEIILGQHLVGIYLDGSLAAGDFDQDSDIDFVVVTDEGISPAQFSQLRGMHERIGQLDSPFAVELDRGGHLSLSLRQAARAFKACGRCGRFGLFGRATA